jgi:D-alanyl-lipoteichoic acid acyltransferase DltB (MBOAT superfamily)
MLFNSIGFAIFLPVVFILYWFGTKNNLRFQNILLLVSSYFFYGCWDWRFMFLLIFSTYLDYFTGIKIHEATNKRNKLLCLWLSIGINLGFLSVFKYYNFFADSFVVGLSLLGLKANLGSINLILPVGISFYTFHGLSYLIDIYKNRINPERNFIDYSVFVSFFPLLVAGPIERATHLLPQILNKREFVYSKAVDGLRQILWGLFKKIVIADNCADYANTIFNNYNDYSGSTLVLGAFFFTFQIYCDFSGYSDIAIGTGRLFGIDLLRNFAFPYFSRDISEFWKRWHISLSSWFRDYVYLPIAYSVSRNIKSDRFYFIKTDFVIYGVGIAITWLLTGLWHGANYTFIIWGIIHGALLIIYRITIKLKKTFLKSLKLSNNNKILILIETLMTFIIVMFSWIFFRAKNVPIAIKYIQGIFSSSLFSIPSILSVRMLIIIGVVVLFTCIEWLQRDKQHPLQFDRIKVNSFFRYAFYTIILISIFWFGGSSQNFIYFQF